MLLKISFVLYCLGMVFTDKYIANSFVNGVEDAYREILEFFGGASMFIRIWIVLLIIFAKVFIPLFWPITWGITIISVITSKEDEA